LKEKTRHWDLKRKHLIGISGELALEEATLLIKDIPTLTITTISLSFVLPFKHMKIA
jgi:hypothetical protein